MLAGCTSDSSSEFVSAGSTNVPTGSVEIRQTLNRAVTTYVSQFRVSGLDNGGNVIFGPQTVDKASRIQLTGIPLAVVRLRIEYLSSRALIGSAEVSVSLTPERLVTIVDPNWVDAPPVAMNSPASSLTYPVGQRPLSVIQGDFNRDGAVDLATANNGGDTISVLLGRGDGTFGAATELASGPSPFGIVTGDFNGDGFLDLVSTNYGGPLQRGSLGYFAGRGDGTFASVVTLAVGDGPTSAAVADLNGDARLDLVCTNFREDTVAVLLGNGDGTFAAPAFFATNVRTRAVAAGDVNGDSRVDLVVANEGVIGEGNVSVLLGRGDGTFASATTLLAGTNPHHANIGDLNGDGRTDFVIANFISNDISVFFGNGDGTFRPEVRLTTGGTPLCTTLGDFNLDGRPDIAVACQSVGEASVLLGRGDGSFNPVVNLKAGNGSFFIVQSDFNRDGRPDFALPNAGGGDVSVLINRP